MERLLLTIANLLYINMQHVTNNSLLKGKMGLILFFYEYGRYTGKHIYTDTADIMLDEIIESLSSNENEVIAGIGWGIQYLIKNKFVEGDSNEILSDIDDRILQMIEIQKEFSSGKYMRTLMKSNFNIFVDSYIVSRVNSKIRNERSFEQIIDLYQNILVKADKPLPLIFLNTCSAFISWAYSFHVEAKKINGIMLLLKDRYNLSFADNLYNAGDLTFFFRIRNRSQMNFSFENVDKCSLETIESHIHYFIPELLYFDSDYYLPDDLLVTHYLHDMIGNVSSKNLSLDGLAGIGILIMKKINISC